MAFERVGDGVGSVLVDWIIDARGHFQLIRAAWDQTVGDVVREQAQPASFRDGVLELRIHDARWEAPLREMHVELRDRLNHRIGAELIRQIRWRS